MPAKRPRRLSGGRAATDIEEIRAAFDRVRSGTGTDTDLRNLRLAGVQLQVVQAEGDRAVAAGGNIGVVVTGDGNEVYAGLGRGGG
jgi:hypothetical protein